MTSRGSFLALATLVSMILASARPAAAEPTYLALGDSLAFGFTDTPTPSNGDRGYVSGFADLLGARNGGIRPHVANLGIYGETSSSFFTGGQPATALNVNYPNGATSQNSLLLSTIAAEKAAGRSIDTVTLQLGANDLFGAAANPSFFALSPAQQQAAVAQVFAAFQAKEATLLTELRTQLPGASLILLGYYNPYAAVPGNPFAPVAGPAIQGLNQIIAGMAAAFGARYVDIYTPFVGHEADYTFITTSGNAFNVHPNALGYAAIDRALGGDAGVLAPTPAPEPGSLTLLAGGLAIGIVALRRRRSA